MKDRKTEIVTNYSSHLITSLINDLRCLIESAAVDQTVTCDVWIEISNGAVRQQASERAMAEGPVQSPRPVDADERCTACCCS